MSVEKSASTAIEKATNEITKALETCSVEHIKALPTMQKAIMLAQGVQAMRAALTDEVVNRLFMPLQGTRLGFRTDKDTGDGYPITVVRECLIEAMIRGFQPVGNEFNIIAGNAYFTKEGFERKLSELEGLTDLAFHPGVPVLKDGGALVPYRVTYCYNGVAGEVKRDLVQAEDKSVSDQRIPVKVNNGMGADGIMGKAKRKLMAQLYDKLTGSKMSTPEGDVVDTVGETVSEEATASTPPDQQKPATDQKIDELVDKHKKQGAEKKTGDNAKAPAGQQTMREMGED